MTTCNTTEDALTAEAMRLLDLEAADGAMLFDADYHDDPDDLVQHAMQHLAWAFSCNEGDPQAPALAAAARTWAGAAWSAKVGG